MTIKYEAIKALDNAMKRRKAFHPDILEEVQVLLDAINLNEGIVEEIRDFAEILKTSSNQEDVKQAQDLQALATDIDNAITWINNYEVEEIEVEDVAATASIRNRRKRGSRKSYKSSSEATLIKGLSGLRKSLIKAEQDARLTVDDLEDLHFLGPDEDSILSQSETASQNIDEAVRCIRKACDHTRAAVDLADRAKMALRGQLVQGKGKVNKTPHRSLGRYRRHRR